jgi:competence protein ComEA
MRPTRNACIALTLIALLMASAAAVGAQDAAKVNINTATVEELTELQGIGTRYAQRIVAYREANGPFTAVDDLLDVKGIGSKILENNRERLMVE